MGIAAGVVSVLFGLWTLYAIDEPQPNQAMAVFSFLLSLAFLAAATVVR